MNIYIQTYISVCVCVCVCTCFHAYSIYVCVYTAYSSLCLSVLFVLGKRKHTLVLHVKHLLLVTHVIRRNDFSHRRSTDISVHQSPWKHTGRNRCDSDLHQHIWSTSEALQLVQDWYPCSSGDWKNIHHQTHHTWRQWTILLWGKVWMWRLPLTCCAPPGFMWVAFMTLLDYQTHFVAGHLIMALILYFNYY